MNKTKVSNVLVSLAIILLSVLISFFVVTANVDIEQDINWYIHWFYGDKKAYFFNIIPMTLWAVVQLAKFALLSLLIAIPLWRIKRRLF